MFEQFRLMRGQPWRGHARATAGGQGAHFLKWLRRGSAMPRIWAEIFVVASVYFIFGRFGLLLAIPPGVASPVWLPSGVALAAVLRRGSRIWPGIWLGSFFVNMGPLLKPGNPPPAFAAVLGTVAAVATGSTLQALLAGTLTRRLIGRRRLFERVRDVLVFAAVAMASCLVAATVSATALTLGGFTPWTGYEATWLTWWLGDLTGILLVVPLALMGRTSVPLQWRPRRLLEAAALLLGLLLAGQVVFGGLFPAGRESHPLPHLLVPLVVWAAIRFGQRGTILTMALIAAMAIGGSVQGWGPFATDQRNTSLLWLQTFVDVAAVTGLVLAAAFTERHVSEQALRESRENFRALADATPVMVWQSGLDKRCHYFNKTWLEFTGRRIEEELGDGWAGGVHADDLPHCLNVYHAAFDQRTPFEMEYRLRHRSGQYRWILDRGTPRFGPGRVFQGFIGGCIDIDDRKRAEAARQAGEERLRLVIESAPNALVMADAAGRIVLVNAQTERLFGYRREELIGQPVTLLVPERFRLRHPAYRRVLMAAPQARRIGAGRDLYGLRKDGREVPVELGLNPIRTDEGVQVLASIVDITERKQAEKEIIKLNAELEHRVEQRTAALAAANRELEAFSYTVSHDLRAPLRHIMGFIDLLEKDSGTRLDETGRDYVRVIAEAGRRMGGLIDDLLALFRLGRATLNEKEVDLGRLVEDARRELAPLAGARAIEWRLGPLPVVRGDPTLLRSALVNLLSNAIKYTRGRSPAKIEIGCRKEDGEAVCFVRDNGAGFDMRFAHKLFGVFQRLHRAEEFEGTGVGLASVRRIIERHGGRIWAEGEVGRGAAFYFTLPQGEG